MMPQAELPENSPFSKQRLARILTIFTIMMVIIMSSSADTHTFFDELRVVEGGSADFPPLVLVFEGGCSGSTATGRFIEKIINAHRLRRYNQVKFEFMNPDKDGTKNPFYEKMLKQPKYANSKKNEILLDSLEIAKMDAKRRGRLFYFKSHVALVEHHRERLDDIGVVYAGVYRENVLDRCICTTKDCFTKEAGYPVFKQNRTKTDLCFSRRKVNEPILTHFDKPTSCLKASLQLQNRIKRLDFPSVSEESLFEFEYTDSDEALSRSVSAWVQILRPFLSDTLDEAKVSGVLQQYRASRPMPLPHKELVSNYEDVEKKLVGTKWELYLRK